MRIVTPPSLKYAQQNLERNPSEVVFHLREEEKLKLGKLKSKAKGPRLPLSHLGLWDPSSYLSILFSILDPRAPLAGGLS